MDDFSCFIAQFLSMFDWLDDHKVWIFLGGALFVLSIVLLMAFASSSKKKNAHD